MLKLGALNIYPYLDNLLKTKNFFTAHIYTCVQRNPKRKQGVSPFLIGAAAGFCMAAVRIPLKGSAPAMLLPDVSRITTRLSADDLVTFHRLCCNRGEVFNLAIMTCCTYNHSMLTNSVPLKGATMTSMKYVVYQEGKYYVSQCLNVDVASFGKTIDEAVINLADAVALYLRDDLPGNHGGLFHDIGNALIGEIAVNA